MNNLIIIGNGFDLAHGLKTSYRDFLLWYLNRAIVTLQTSKVYADKIMNIHAPYAIVFDKGKPFNTLDSLYKVITRNNVRFEYTSDFIDAVFSASVSGSWVDIEYTYYRSLILKIESVTHDPLNKTMSRFNAIKSINDGLYFLKERLIEYLRTEIADRADRNPNISQVLSKITKNGLNKSKAKHSTDQSTLILNFNYTNTIDLYNEELITDSSGFNKINIHGALDSSNNPIIFGYGDEMDPKYTNLENLNLNSALDYIKSFHYLRTNNYKTLSSFINSNVPYNVHIMGHSCGISDRVLLSSIFGSINCKSIKIYYYKREDGTTDFFEKTQEISRHFKPEFKEKMREKIDSFEDCESLS